MSNTYYITYRLFCSTESNHVVVSLPRDDPLPTTCPNNSNHTIEPGSLCIINRSYKTQDELFDHCEDRNNPHQVNRADVGLTFVENIKNNFVATSNPTANHDSVAGYSIGSQWFNTSTKKGYICVDSTVAQAIWKKTAIETTDDIPDSSNNQYYTETRFNNSFGNKTTSNLAEGSNLYYTQSRFNTAFAAKSTSDLTEGSNLYYTTTRFNNALATKTTTDLAEGTNKYYTESRVSANTSVAANTSHRSQTNNPHQVSLSQAANQESLLQTRGSLLTRDASALKNLAIGSSGKMLVSDGNEPVWSSDVARLNETQNNYTISVDGSSGKYQLVATSPGIVNLTTATNNDALILPDATTLPNGWLIHIINNPSSTTSLKIKDFGENELRRINAGDYITALLINNDSANGSWKLQHIIERNIINVSKTGGHFHSIKSAIDSITDASSTNQYIILVAPGVYQEATITMKSYVYVYSYSPASTIITPQSVSQTIIIGASYSELNMIGISGASSGIGILSNSNIWFVIRNVNISNCNILVKLTATSGPSVVSHIGSMYGTFSKAVWIDGRTITGSGSIKYSLVGSTVNGSASTTHALHIEGPNANASIVGTHFTGLTSGSVVGKGVLVSDGSTIKMLGCSSTYWVNAFEAENVGAGPVIEIGNIFINDSTNDIIISHPSANGVLTGMATKSKVSIDENCTMSVNYTDPTDNCTVIVGELCIGRNHAELTDITCLIEFSASLGLLNGGEMSKGTGSFDVNITAGVGYVKSGTGATHRLIEVYWNNTTITLPDANTTYYIAIESDGTIIYPTAEPDLYEHILLGRVRTNTTTIEFIDFAPIMSQHATTNNIIFERDILGANYLSGSIVSYNSSREIAISSGVFYYSNKKYTPTGKTSPADFDVYYHSSSNWTSTSSQIINNTQYDNGTNLTSLTTDYYTKHTLYLVGEGSNEKYLLIIGQAEYATLNDCVNGPISTPPSYFGGGVVRIASFVVKQGASTIQELIDERPSVRATSSQSAGVSAHGDLSGLNGDDHPQYLLANGTRTMTGNLNMGSHNIITSGLVGGINAGTHASRHLPNGADPLTTAAPLTTLTTATTNSTGTANSFARSDHTHAFNQTTIDHTQIQNKGTYTHAQIDSHIDATTGAHGISGSIVGTSDTQTLTNKTIRGNGSTSIIGASQLETTGAAVVISSADPPTAGQILKATSATSAIWTDEALTSFGTKMWILMDVKPNSTNGGTFSSGGWQKRELNTMHYSDGSEITLDGNNNRFNIAPGKYYIRAIAPAYSCGHHKIRVSNSSNSTVYGYGTSAICSSSNAHITYSEANLVMNVASSMLLQIDHRCQTTRATTGFGIANGFGTGIDEVYTQVIIQKIYS